jgi:hypothetical protein
MAEHSKPGMNTKLTKFIPWSIAIIAVALLGLTLIIRDPSRFVQPVEHLRSSQCWDQSIKMIHPDKVDMKLLKGVADLCYIERDHEYHLENKRIQRQVFVEQNFVGRVMLWMVVAITISGVLLAALQLFASFKLAVQGHSTLSQEGSVSLEGGKIAVKSSVTGLLILVVSFAFFMVFVDKVYTISQVNGAPPVVATDPTALGATAASASFASTPGAVKSLPVPMDELDAENTTPDKPASASSSATAGTQNVAPSRNAKKVISNADLKH